METVKIKVFIKRPDERGHVSWISNTLENLQRTVGGYIEVVPLGYGANGAVVICNEEGRIQGLEPNCILHGVSYCGTIIVAGTAGEEFTDVPFMCSTLKALCQPYNPQHYDRRTKTWS